MTDSPGLLQPVRDHRRVEEAKMLIAPVLASAFDFDPEWLRDHSWTVVPVESGMHFDEPDARQLAKGMRALDVHTCLAIATEPLAAGDVLYSVDASEDGLLAFSFKCGSLNFALTDEHVRFVVVCTSSDYFLVAGPEEFVHTAIDGDVTVAQARFRNFVDHLGDFASSQVKEIAGRYPAA